MNVGDRSSFSSNRKLILVECFEQADNGTKIKIEIDRDLKILREILNRSS